MLELLEEQHPEILLGGAWIDESERDAVECEVPGGEPRILPLVRHGEDAHGIQVAPVNVANVLARFGRRAAGIITVEPKIYVEEIRLLVPKHAGERLALDQPVVARCRRRMDRIVEFVSLLLALLHDCFYFRERIAAARCLARRPQAHGKHEGLSRGNIQRVVKARLRACLLRIDAIFAMNQAAMECIFHKWLAAGVAGAENAGAIRLIVREKKVRALRAVEARERERVFELEICERVHAGRVGLDDERLSARGAATDDAARAPEDRPTPRYCGTRDAARGAASLPRGRD